ncbi:MAG: RNA-binding S4 domain-containing protein [Paludibacteraceae bacterium]|nr:RNA-binding S4 domain-containing protein [Paludibacteraceae bacterium]MBO7233632.1 RNA-binding S4 domain-containing protein [Paludibacteraceae bacterium]MBO7259566.1 RNA-binding S4 domain-containing protein [Paludibacteraceae bacterium]
MAEVRIDKWLWAVRLYKTRSLAAEACKKGKVSCNGQTLKPSHVVKVGEVYHLRRAPITFSYKVLALAHNRMAAKLVPDFMLDVTAPDQLQLLELNRLAHAAGRARGTGRPTKKERRDLEMFIDPTDWIDDMDDFELDEDVNS